MQQTGAATKQAKISPVTPSGVRGSEDIPELHQRIALRAYQLFEGRGGSEGSELDDWLLAERELTNEQENTNFK